MKRIFIALPISTNLQAEAAKFKNKYPALPVRWLAGENLHITLIPPWYEDNSGIEKLKNKLKEIPDKLKQIPDKLKQIFNKIPDEQGQSKIFSLTFGKVCFGPNPYQPRLIWAEGKTPQRLIELKKILELSLNKALGKRNFLLHLTLARFRPEDFKNFSTKNLNGKISWREKVNSLVLMQSHLSRSGADYEVLEKVEL